MTTKSENNHIDYITHRPETELLRLWEESRASKQGHNYLALYHRHFSEQREQVEKVLEIGVQTDRSVRMWEKYFPNATIYGLDLDPKCKQFEGGRVKIHIGDQSSPQVLDQLPKDFDIIIDDGSHIPEHQIGTFIHLFQNNMKPRGIYVVEDTENRPATNEFFGQLISLVNFWPQDDPELNWPHFNSFEKYTSDYFICNVLGVSFYRYIIFIDKGRNPEDGEAAYRHRWFADIEKTLEQEKANPQSNLTDIDFSYIRSIPGPKQSRDL